MKAAAVAGLAGLALVACGGDDPPSRAEYARTLDTACARAERAFLRQPPLPYGDVEARLRKRRRDVRIAREYLRTLRETDAPDGIGDELERVTRRVYEVAPSLADLERRSAAAARAYDRVGARRCARLMGARTAGPPGRFK